MKKFFLTTGLFLGLVFTVEAQTAAGIHFGYGSDIDRPAVGANAEFGITDKITVAPDFTYYLLEKITGVKSSAMEFNANAHYYFLEKDKLGVFGLGGLNYTRATVKMDGFDSESNGDVGFNLGGGARYDLNDTFQVFSTLKFTVGSTDQLALFIGARYKF